MLLADWGKWLLGAIASRQSLDLSAPPPGGHAVEVVKVTRFVLQAPLVVPTVTVTQTEIVGGKLRAYVFASVLWVCLQTLA